MREACVAAVERAIGRELGQGEARGIEARVRLWSRLLARRDEALWRGLSRSEQLTMAAQAAAKDLMADVSKARQRASLAIAAWDRDETMLARYDASTLQGRLQRLAALSRTLAFDPAGSGENAIESRAQAMGAMARGQLLQAIRLASPRFLGLFENTAGIHDLIKEVYGEDSKNPDAKAAADAWKKVADEMRDRNNAAGGDIGKLGEQYFPQHHAKWKVGNAGFDSWFSYIEPRLDKGKYLEPDGTRMAPRAIKEFFQHVFNTIISDGDLKSMRTPGQEDMVGPLGMSQRPSGYGLFADRNAQHRQVFFKDSQSFIDYQGKFGDQSFLSTMLGHVNRLARDTAIMEGKGPFADQAFKAINDRERLAAIKAHPDEASQRKIEKAHSLNEAIWRYVSGQREVHDSRVDRAFLAFRNLITGLRLGKVVLTALGDEAGMAATAVSNRSSYLEMARNQLRVLNPADHSDRAAMESLGIGLNSKIGAINRYGAEDWGRGASGRFANLIMRITGAERLWDARRQAASMTIMHAVGQASRTVEHVSGLSEADQGMLARKGIGEPTWQVWRRAEVNPDGAVTPHEIWAIPDSKLADLGDSTKLKRDATTALMAHAWEEGGMGVMETGAREHARVNVAMGKLGLNTESSIGKSLMLFKTFSSSMVMKHWARAASLGTLGSRLGYFTILAAYGTMIAAARNMLGSILAGQNPQDYSGWKPWMGAVLRGGGMGFYGDFLYDEMNSHDQNISSALGGPIFTSTQDVWNVTGKPIFQMMRGEKTQEGASLIRFGKDNMPLASLWYTSAIFDHMLTYQLQEMANPGYLDRMQARQEKFGRTYWWDPHDLTPTQGPEFGKAVGQ